MPLRDDLSAQLNVFIGKKARALENTGGLIDKDREILLREVQKEYLEAVRIAGEALNGPNSRNIVAGEIKAALLSVREALAKIDIEERTGDMAIINFTNDILRFHG